MRRDQLAAVEDLAAGALVSVERFREERGVARLHARHASGTRWLAIGSDSGARVRRQREHEREEHEKNPHACVCCRHRAVRAPMRTKTHMSRHYSTMS
jgi:hypothetical protein